MKLEEKVVSQRMAEQLVVAGWKQQWKQQTKLSWMKNSEGWLLHRTEDAVSLSHSRLVRKLSYWWYDAPDVSELLDALRPYMGVLSIYLSRYAEVILARPATPDITCEGETLQESLAQLWIAVHAESQATVNRL